MFRYRAWAAVLAVLLLLGINACGRESGPAAAVSDTPTSGIQLPSEPAEPVMERLPTIGDAGDGLLYDPSPLESSPGQFFLGDSPDVYALERAILHLNYTNGGIILPDFQDIRDVWQDRDIALLQITALHRVPKIRFPIQFPESLLEDQLNHPVYQLALVLSEEHETDIDCYKYIEDLIKVITALYGEDNPALLNVRQEVFELLQPMVRVHSDEGVVVELGGIGGGSEFPQITYIEKTDQGYICEAMLVRSDEHSLENGEQLYNADHVLVPFTQENLEANQNRFPKFRFEFRLHNDGRLTLNALETLYIPEGYWIPWREE